MAKKNLILGIIIGLILIGLSFNLGYKTGAKKALSLTQEKQEKPVLEGGNLAKLMNLGVIQGSFNTNGVVKKISDHTLSLVQGREKGESEPFEISVSENAKIISMYVLLEGTPSEKVAGSMTNREGKEIKLGKEEIDFKDIKVGDTVNIVLEAKPDGSYGAIEAMVWPSDLLQ